MARKHPDVPLVIDFHTHMLDAELREICTSRNAITGFGKKQAPPSANLKRFLDPDLQVADMDERGIDMHVVFTGPVHMSAWWADPHFYYDTCLYDPLAMQTLFKRVGADRIVLGADYPVGGTDPVGEVKEAVTLSNEELRMVAAGTAAKLLGIEARPR